MPAARLVSVGTPADLMRVPPRLAHRAGVAGRHGLCARSARRARFRRGRTTTGEQLLAGAETPSISIHGAREHNLKNVDVELGLKQVHGDHRRFGQRQEHAGVRYSVCRGAAALLGVAQRLCTPVRTAGLAPRRRCHLRDSAHRGHRQMHEPRRAQEHGGHADRDLSLLAIDVREARRAALPGVRRTHRTAVRRRHRGAPSHRIPRQAHCPAGTI